MIIFGAQEAAPFPEQRRLLIDGINHQCPSPDERRSQDTSLQRVLDEAGSDPLPRPSGIGGKLAEKKAGNGVGRLARADRTRQDRRHHGRRRQTIIADDAPRLMDHENGGKAFLLIGKGARLQPVIERRLATGEFGYIMRGGEQFGS